MKKNIKYMFIVCLSSTIGNALIAMKDPLENPLKQSQNIENSLSTSQNNISEALDMLKEDKDKKDAIRFPYILFQHSRPKLSRQQCLPVTYFEKNNDAYDIEYKDENNNLQKMSIPSSLEYNNEPFAIIKTGKKQFTFLQLSSAEEPTQSTESSIILEQESIQHIETQLQTQLDTSPQTQAEISGAKEELLESFKEILQEEREQLIEEQNKQKVIADAISQAVKLDKNIKSIFDKKKTYIIGASIAVIFIAILTYMYKYNKLPAIFLSTQ